MRLTVGTKLGSLILLSVLLVAIAGVGGFIELYALGQETTHLANAIQVTQPAMELELKLVELHTVIVTNALQRDAARMRAAAEPLMAEIDANAVTLNRLLIERKDIERANTVESIRGIISSEVRQLLLLAERDDWHTFDLRLNSQFESARSVFITQSRELGAEVRLEAANALESARQSQHNSIYTLSIIVVGALLLLGFGGGLLWRNLIAPIRRLMHSAAQIAAGDLDVRAGITRRADEIGALAGAFDAMADQVKASHASLADQVATRTAELSAERAALQATLTDLQAAAAEREQLFDTLRQIENPVIPVFDDVVVAPIVGQLTNDRLRQLQLALLRAVEFRHARIVLIDITGVPIITEEATHQLFALHHSLKLLGATAVLVGIHPEVAQSMVSFQTTNTQDILTTIDLERGINLALRMLRRQIVTRAL